MKPTYTLTVTKADLDAAIAARKEQSYDCCRSCLIAQAHHRQGGFSSVGHHLQHEGFLYRVTGRARQAMTAFDEGSYAEARAMLPFTVTLKAS